eukprot:12917891-Prorocentrum_lima.AAC.1
MCTQEADRYDEKAPMNSLNYRVVRANGAPIDFTRLCLACDSEETGSRYYLTFLNADTDTESDMETEITTDA